MRPRFVERPLQSSSEIHSETKKLGRSSLYYLVPNLLVRGLTILLTPLYTRHMSVDDYGLVAFCNTVSTLLGVVLGFSISSAITRIDHECGSDAERRQFYGTILGFTLVVPTVLGLLLEVAGRAGVFHTLITTVPFEPYLSLALWTGVLNLHFAVPLAMLATHERPRAVAVLNVLVGAVQAAVTIILVVGLRAGARGAIVANLVAAGFASLLSLVVMWQYIELRLSRRLLLQSLAFSIPLVPHVLSNWALSVSDRIILERYVSKADLGRFSLGYLFSLAVSMFITALLNALSPMIVRHLRADAKSPIVPHLGTLAVFLITLASLAAMSLGRDVVELISPSTYHDAARVIPWVVGGAFLQGIYMVISQGTWFSMKTRWIPVITGIAAFVNVALNLVLVPRYGIMASAVDTAIGYGVLALLHARLAARTWKIEWDYRRWALMTVVAGAIYAATALLPLRGVAGFGLRTVAVLLFPVVLVLLRIFVVSDLTRLVRAP